jgi:hypothetical protein
MPSARAASIARQPARFPARRDESHFDARLLGLACDDFESFGQRIDACFDREDLGVELPIDSASRDSEVTASRP